MPVSSGDGRPVASSLARKRMSWAEASLDEDDSLQEHKRSTIEAVRAVESAIEGGTVKGYMRAMMSGGTRCATDSCGPTRAGGAHATDRHLRVRDNRGLARLRPVCGGWTRTRALQRSRTSGAAWAHGTSRSARRRAAAMLACHRSKRQITSSRRPLSSMAGGAAGRMRAMGMPCSSA